MLVFIKNCNNKNIKLKSSINVLEKTLKNDRSRILINNFYTYIVEDKTISKQIKKLNYDFFDSYKHDMYGDNKIFTNIQNLFVKIDNSDKKQLIEFMNKLRKISKVYDTSDE
jgi:hypothetical protein